MDDAVKKSKRLSKALRHDPSSIGVKLDAAGWAPVVDVCHGMKLRFEQLEQIVANNDKKRFEFNEDRTQIRASQGHSVEVELGYEQQDPPEMLYHGTSPTLLTVIRNEGLRKMGRHHVHLSVDRDTAKTVGARRGGVPVILVVRAQSMLHAGHKFYRSTNGVWLTDSVPPQFICQ